MNEETKKPHPIEEAGAHPVPDPVPDPGPADAALAAPVSAPDPAPPSEAAIPMSAPAPTRPAAAAPASEAAATGSQAAAGTPAEPGSAPARPVQARGIFPTRMLGARDRAIPEGEGSGTEPAPRLRLRRVRQPLSPRKIILFSFLIPFLTLAFAYAANGFYPVADKSPLTIDLYHQYAPFLAQLRDKLLNGDSFFYSWRSGLGTNFFAQTAYYHASPLNLILLPLFPPAFLTEAVTLLTLIKIGGIGATSACLLLWGFCPERMRTMGSAAPAELRYTSQVGTDFAVMGFASAFALSGFMLAYSWDIMWLDAILFFPLIILGLLRLVREGRFLLYTLSLAACIMVNYYIALFICLFTALYYFVAYFSFESDSPAARRRPLGHFLVRGLQFAGASLLGALLSAVVALPTYLALQTTSATGDAFPASVRINFSLFAFLQRQLIGLEPDIREGLPNVYVGVMVLLLVPLYVFVRSIKLKEKLWHLGLLFFMYLSFANNYLDFIWHGMHYPNQLPFRYAFVYSLLLLVVAFRTLTHIREVPRKVIAAAGVLAFAYVFLSEELLKDSLSHGAVYLSLGFILVYTALLGLFRQPRGLRSFRNVSFALTLILVTELIVNSLISVVYIHKNEYYTTRSDFNGDLESLRAEIAELRAEDPGFWRMEMIQQKTTNSPSLYGYRGVTLFSSTSYEGTAKLMRRLGYHGNNINSYKYTASTELLDAILGVKYLLNKERAIADPYLERVGGSGDVHVYKNPLALPPLFALSEQILNWSGDGANPFAIQNAFVQSGGAHERVFIPRALENTKASNYSFSEAAELGLSAQPVDGKLAGSVELEIRAERDEHLYLYVSASADTQVEIRLLPEEDAGAAPADAASPDAPAGGAQSGSAARGEAGPGEVEGSQSRNANVPEIFDLGFVREGRRVHVRLSTKADKSRELKLFAAASDRAALEAAVATWRASAMEVEAFTENSLSGSLRTERAGQVFTSIPYDAAWEVRVDGAEVTPTHLANAFLTFPVQAGRHRIELRYTPPGFCSGALISAVALIVLLMALLLCRIVKKHRNRAKNRA